MLANTDAEVLHLTAPRDDDRRQMVAELRARYLDGSLDEVLVPSEAEVPDTLLQALFPNLFGGPPIGA